MWAAPVSIRFRKVRFLYTQDLVSTSVSRLRKVSTKGNIADLHTKLLLVDRLRRLCELRYPNSSAVYYNFHFVRQHDCHARLVQHYRTNTLHDYKSPHFTQCSISYCHTQPGSLHYVL